KSRVFARWSIRNQPTSESSPRIPPTGQEKVMIYHLFISRKRFMLIALLMGWKWMGLSTALGAQGMDPASRAEGRKGYIFETSHDELVAKAKREQGAMQAHISQGPETIKAVVEAFKAEYPFVNAQVKEMTGTDESQRFILQVKAGRAQDFDAGQ